MFPCGWVEGASVPALQIQTERWPLAEPFRISGYIFTDAEVIVVSLSERGRSGRGDFVDMDGAIVLAKDGEPSVVYRHGEVMCPRNGWGAPR